MCLVVLHIILVLINFGLHSEEIIELKDDKLKVTDTLTDQD